MAKRIRRTALICAALFIAFILLSEAFRRWGEGIPCVIRSITGLYCPGCGTTRALVSLAGLDFYQALRYNVLFVACLPYLSFEAVFSAYKYIRYGRYGAAAKARQCDLAIAVVIALAAVLFAFARNFEPLAFLAPTVVG